MLLQEEAEELYKKSKRYDLLNQFYQASGHWTKVHETAITYSRLVGCKKMLVLVCSFVVIESTYMYKLT